MNKKLILLTILMLGVLVLGAGCNGSTSAVPDIQREKVAYVGTVPFEPPLVYQEEAELVGPDAELGKRIIQRIQETSRAVVDEIPKCPLDTEKIFVQVGQPAERIIATAQQGNYDLVIMGTHGHSKLDNLMLGSVARDVVHGCPVPVMVIRLPDHRSQKRQPADSRQRSVKSVDTNHLWGDDQKDHRFDDRRCQECGHESQTVG